MRKLFVRAGLASVPPTESRWRSQMVQNTPPMAESAYEEVKKGPSNSKNVPHKLNIDSKKRKIRFILRLYTPKTNKFCFSQNYLQY